MGSGDSSMPRSWHGGCAGAAEYPTLMKLTAMVAGVLAASLNSRALGAALLLPGVLSTSLPEGCLSQLGEGFRHPCPAFTNSDGSAPSALLQLPAQRAWRLYRLTQQGAGACREGTMMST